MSQSLASPWTHYSSEEETQLTQLKIPDPEILKQPYSRNMTSKTDSKKLVPVKAAAAEETTTALVSIKFRKPEVKPNADEDAYTPEVSPDYDFREIMDGSLSNAQRGIVVSQHCKNKEQGGAEASGHGRTHSQ